MYRNLVPYIKYHQKNTCILDACKFLDYNLLAQINQTPTDSFILFLLSIHIYFSITDKDKILGTGQTKYQCCRMN